MDKTEILASRRDIHPRTDFFRRLGFGFASSVRTGDGNSDPFVYGRRLTWNGDNTGEVEG